MAAQEPAKLLESAWKIIPFFQCTDVHRSAKFYESKLGFNIGVDDDDGGRMVSVFIGKRADANIYIFRTPAEKIQPSTATIALGTKELDEYYEYIKGQTDVEITMQIEDQPWGYRQFEIKDPDGNKLQFFKFLVGGNPGLD